MGALLERTAELVPMQANSKQLPWSPALVRAFLCSVSILARPQLLVLPLGCPPLAAHSSVWSSTADPWGLIPARHLLAAFVAHKGSVVFPNQLLEEHRALALPLLMDPHGSSQQS